ncbi:hypothetical protein JG687_00017101 [Phytophthora cactorum]|uniref:ADP-ribosylation/Crystallin J1 n=1 Tax=Phytophthora cactorum TaxID=29920 RepID=A0A8T1TSC8_9STRA|nr:hypothetical protein JG687_00017101 [Phytophthora cactorum]
MENGSGVLRRVGENWDRAYGAFLGLLCGDAAGAMLEFSPGVITEPDASRAMSMPGGGVFGVGKGQITDDSELALSLARGLLGHRPRAVSHGERFVNNYVNSVVRTCFLEESLDISSLVCTRKVGHVRWAFVLATYFLRQNESYKRAIQQTLLKGGDTDTNAAIIGGLIGALHGVESIPSRMREAVLTFDATKPASTHRLRPVGYCGAHVTKLAEKLLNGDEVN